MLNLILAHFNRLASNVKMFIGGLNEEVVQLNLTLVNEIIDESIECGMPQLSSPDQLQAFIFSKPVTPQPDYVHKPIFTLSVSMNS